MEYNDIFEDTPIKMSVRQDQPGDDELSPEEIAEIVKNLEHQVPHYNLDVDQYHERKMVVARLQQKAFKKPDTDVTTDYVNHIAQLVEKVETKNLSWWDRFKNNLDSKLKTLYLRGFFG
jgi:hypothetical protein